MDAVEKAKAVIRASKAGINRYMLNRTVTIVSHDEVDYLDHGSGVLLQLEEAHIVLTAGHVIMKKPPESLQIIASERMTNEKFAPTAKARRGGKIFGGVDVGYLRLNPTDLHRLTGKSFLKLTDLELFPPTISTDLVMLQGMPEVRHTVKDSARHTFESYTFMATLDRDVDWAGKRPVQIKVDYPHFIENALSDQIEEPFDTEGMSGGGMWRARFAGDPIWTFERLRLVGIIVEINRESRVVPVNTLEALMQLLAIKFPSAKSFLQEQRALLKRRVPQIE